MGVPDRVVVIADTMRHQDDGETSVTVCVAAICAGNFLCGMSDRMLTAGDVKFEPSSTKIWQLTNSIAMMLAGDVGLQTEIHARLQKTVMERLMAAPTEWMRVADAAKLYRRAYFDIKKERAEAKILIPLGLDNESFLNRQKGMDSSLVSEISAELINFKMPSVEAIIAGNNPPHGNVEGTPTAHVFTIENGQLSCLDQVGFACIGAGAWHASSIMMTAGHTPETDIPAGLLNIYSAKKRAEIAPGVGTETDVFIMTGALGSYNTLRDEIWTRLPVAHKDMVEQIDKIRKGIEESFSGFVEEITKPKPPAKPAAPH